MTLTTTSTMSREEIIQIITENIYPNGNNEITANVLNPVLDAMVNQINDITGDLGDLASTDTSNLVNSINSVIQQFQDIDSNSVKLHSGIDNPNDVPPANYNTADFYIQEDINGDPLYLWQFNGIRWNKQNTEDDRFVTYGEITKVGNEINVSTGYSWIIDDVLNSNNASQDFIIEDAETGQSRVDIIVTSGDGFELIQGQESAGEGSALQPETPIGSLLLTSINIYEDNVSDPAPVGSDYITKKSFGWTTKNITGSNTFLTITDFTNAYNIVNNSLVSIDGVQTTGLPNTLEYDGQLIWIKNGSTTTFVLNANVDDFNLMPFKFPTSGNFTMAVGSVACFKRFSNTMELITYNISDGGEDIDQTLAIGNTTNKDVTFTNGTQYSKIFSNGYIQVRDNSANGNKIIQLGSIPLEGNPYPFRILSGTNRDKDMFHIASGGDDNSGHARFGNGNNEFVVFANQTGIGANQLISYIESAPTTMAGRNLIDANFLNAGLALKANLNGGNNLGGPQTVAGRISSENATADSRINIETSGANPYIQGANFADNAAKAITINRFGGFVGFGKFNPDVMVDILGDIKITGLNFLGKYTTGTEPAYQSGAMYFNTSINKLKVGGASTWEVYNAIETARSVSATISATSATYQNNALIGATNISMVVLNGDITQGPFTFNSTTGTITMAVMATDLITVYFNKN